MKRTAEIVLTVIGVVLSGLTAIIGIFFNTVMSDPEFQGFMEEELSADPSLAETDISGVMGIFDVVGPSLLIVGLLSLVLGVISIFAIKGNKKPVLAGILLILAALVIGFGTIGFGFVPAILFLIAGIMSLARKPKTVSI